MANALLCYAHGRDTEWEAICVDLDIAVQGRSFDEVRSLLSSAIASYVADAAAESPRDALRLLTRRAPFHVRAVLALRLAWYNLMHGKQDREMQASFPVLCPA